MSEMAEKWGRKVAERGFAQVPNYLLLMNQFLEEDQRLSPVEMGVLIQLVGAWWKKDEAPFPALRTLAVRVGVSERQAQRAVTRLEADGYLKREKRKRGRLLASNSYNLAPLVEHLNEVALAFPNDSPRKVSPVSRPPTKVRKLRLRPPTQEDP
jgi:hypothetical protein